MIDIIIVILIVIVLLCSIVTYYNINNNSKKYKDVSFKENLSGLEVAEKLLENNDLDNMYIVETKNFLEEKYDVNRKVIRLLPNNFHGTSISNGLMAAFFAGHAIMDKKNKLLHFKNAIMFIVNIFVYLSYICIVISCFMRDYDYLKLGIIVLFLTVLFHVITLPLEKEVAQLIINNIKDLDLIEKDDIDKTKELLNSLTYRYICSPITLITSLIVYLKNKI